VEGVVFPFHLEVADNFHACQGVQRKRYSSVGPRWVIL
jgi:hypothetical protein